MKSNTAIVCLSPYSGGMELDSIRLYKLLSSEMSVFLVVKKDSQLEEMARKKIPDERICPIKFRFNLGPALVRNFKKILKTEKIKNVIYFGASELVSLHFACLNFDVNFIVRHGTTKSHSKKDFYHKLIYSNVNWHIAISNHILKNVKKIIPISENTQLKRIYLSRDINDSKTPNDDKKIKIIHVSRIAVGKGQLDAVVAVKKLKDEGLKFEINFLGSIDDKEYYYEITKLIDENNMKDMVHFRGHVHNVIDYLKISDIFLFPSYGEGLSNSLIESMALGLVPVTYDNTVFPEFKRLGFHIVLANDRDIQMLSDNLYDVATNLEEHLEMSKMNIKKYGKYFSPHIEKDNYLSVLV